MSMGKLKKLSNDVLKLAPGKQILQFPQNLSGGRIHASSPNEVWQADSASMFSFGGGVFSFALLMFSLVVRGRNPWLQRRRER